jgi:hypothetical protein
VVTIRVVAHLPPRLPPPPPPLLRTLLRRSARVRRRHAPSGCSSGRGAAAAAADTAHAPCRPWLPAPPGARRRRRRRRAAVSIAAGVVGGRRRPAAGALASRAPRARCTGRGRGGWWLGSSRGLRSRRAAHLATLTLPSSRWVWVWWRHAKAAGWSCERVLVDEPQGCLRLPRVDSDRAG